jgi:hypothetical protein
VTHQSEILLLSSLDVESVCGEKELEGALRLRIPNRGNRRRRQSATSESETESKY